MNKRKLFLIFFVFCLSCGIFCQKDEYNDKQNISIEYNGLTGTLTNLINAQKEQILYLGSNNILMKQLFEHDYSNVLECDSAISEYINSEKNEYYYEELANIIENEILQRFEEDEDVNAFVLVEPSEQENGMVFNFYVDLEKPVILPISIENPDNLLTIKFNIKGVVKETINCVLLFDSNEVINGDMYKGIKVRFDSLSINLLLESQDSLYDESVIPEDVVPGTVEVVYHDAVSTPKICDLALFATINWYLHNVNEGDLNDGDDMISYEDILNKNCRWFSSTESAFTFNFNTSDIKVDYNYDELFEKDTYDNVIHVDLLTVSNNQ